MNTLSLQLNRVVIAGAVVIVTLSSSALCPAEVVSISAPYASDFVHDRDRDILYITSGPEVLRYQLSSRTFLPSFSLGGDLCGIDISPDHKTLLVADRSYTSTNAWLHEISLESGVSQKIAFPRGGTVAGGTFLVAFGSDGSAVFTAARSYGSGSVPVRRIDQNTGTVTTIGSAYQNSLVSASADGSVAVVTVVGTSPSQVIRYRFSDGNMEMSRPPHVTADGTGAAVSRNGDQFAAPHHGGTIIYNENLDAIITIPDENIGILKGLVYSPVQDVLYCMPVGTRAITAFNSNTFEIIDTFALGHDVGSGFGGRMKTSRDGRFLFVLNSGVGVDMVNVPVPEPSTAVLLSCWVLVLAFIRRKSVSR